jgi:hypothetical protein
MSAGYFTSAAYIQDATGQEERLFVLLAQEINGDINRKCIVIVQLFFVERTPTKYVLDSAATLYGFFSLFGPNFRSILLLT